MNQNAIKAVVSVSEMCRQLNLSRSQYYLLAKKGVFHKPLYLESNKRPYFTASMVEDNLRVRDTSIGVNGEYVLFYQSRTEAKNDTKQKPKEKQKHKDLIASLKQLGLDATVDQVEQSISANFPRGIECVDQSNILRTVFRHLKNRNVSP
jgi:hypothetical protein